MRTPAEVYMLAAVARNEVFRDFEGDQEWPICGDPARMSPERTDVLAKLAADGLVALGEERPADRRQWWELTDKALEG